MPALENPYRLAGNLTSRRCEILHSLKKLKNTVLLPGMDPNESVADKTLPSRDAVRMAYAALGAILLLFGLIRLRLLAFPLERDEGEYAYAGQLMLKSLPIYHYCHTMKLPGTAAVYALIMAALGQTPSAIHMGLLLINGATTVIVFFLAMHLLGPLAAVVAAASFAVLSIEPALLGQAAHATQFVLLPALAGILLLLHSLSSHRLLALWTSGLLLGVAVLMKQPAIFFVLFAFCILLRHLLAEAKGLPRIAALAAIFLLAVALPLIFTCVFLLFAGDFPPFWFWTVRYAGAYGTRISFREGLELFWLNSASLIMFASFIWLFAAAGITACIVDDSLRRRRIFLLGFLVFSFAAVCPGLYFRQHYYILLLPAASLLCGVAVSSLTRYLMGLPEGRVWKRLPAVLFAAAMLICLVEQREFFFQDDLFTLCRMLYRENPFIEAQTIAAYIKEHSREDDKIAILGSEPELLFYAHRLSATGYIYMYPLMELQPYAPAMQQEAIAEITASHPKFIVFVRLNISWLVLPSSDKNILTWSQRYVHDHYNRIGVIDIFAERAEYHWNEPNYLPQSPYNVLVFERK